jgi:hypothetical protein
MSTRNFMIAVALGYFVVYAMAAPMVRQATGLQV